jgi:hypothetical protein
MKKLLALLLAVSCLSVTYAQSSAEKAKRVIRGERRDYDPDNNSRDVVIGGNRRPVYDDRDYRSGSSSRAAIDREYDAKIRYVQNNHKLRRTEKNRIIRELEVERARRIADLNNSYGYNRNDRRYAERSGEDRRFDDDKRYNKKNQYKGNNGKHLGWQKGKGNPHRWN